MRKEEEDVKEEEEEMRKEKEARLKALVAKRKLLQHRLVQRKREVDSIQVEKNQSDQDLETSTFVTKQKCLQLREQLDRDRQVARKKLVDLTTQSAAATKKLQGVISKGEKILRLSEVCHKLQTKLKIPTLEHEQTFCESGNLQHHLNVALQHRELLRKQKQDLIRENRQMELLLQHMKDGPLMVFPALSLSVPPDAKSADGTALCGGATAPPDGPTDSDHN
ncbi:trichohyalin [Austrofundulus limnaeus]|uniref:Trichohyalin n=1 Tax=Austrofundulus limnaeus TaxID=52670 RepID=A0A2I4BVU3_AUSLI|nr:PREDICTED: coiled-coil domain-containing protein 65 [Austrofundulus limnaeus]